MLSKSKTLGFWMRTEKVPDIKPGSADIRVRLRAYTSYTANLLLRIRVFRVRLCALKAYVYNVEVIEVSTVDPTESLLIGNARRTAA